MLNSSSQDMDQTERQINLLKTQTAAITTTALQALKKAKIEYSFVLKSCLITPKL